MPLFSFPYQYIDDLCIINNLEVQLFLQLDNPLDSPRDDMSSFWIYPLLLVELQVELETTRDGLPYWGLSGHFLNVKLTIFYYKFGQSRQPSLTNVDFCHF